jgi:nicotinate-nucleotide pyrophosphorylase (carboxylating)
MKKNSKIEKIIKLALLEDIGSGDITSDSVVPTNRKADAVLLVKSNGIISGLDVAKKVFKLLDKKIVFQKLVKDGQYVESGKIISIIKGPARSILSAERTALNFLQRMSGISTLTNEFVNQIKGTNAKILDTRKTSPCLRYFDKYAVKMGGGYNHRLGLFDMILIKDNHIAVSGSITKELNYVEQI